MTDRAGRTHDLGKGFTLTEFYSNGILVGYTINGPAAPQCKSSYQGRCGGLCAIRPYVIEVENFRKEYPVWAVDGDWPNITLSPSVACDCGGQHSFVRDGRWI